MAQRTVRFGIIGCGLMGREFASAAARWCHLLDMDVRPEIIAICDANPAALEWFTDNLSIGQVTSDYQELLNNPAVEAVYCAVPHDLHEQLYVDILRAGKHLLAEKPFGIDLPACERILVEVQARPDQLVRCSSEFPFLPGPRRIIKMIKEEQFGEIIEVRSGLLHSSDLDPSKPINWKRTIAHCGEYGCMGDLGMHIIHVPARVGWEPTNVRAILSDIVKERPNGKSGMAACETWDNAVMICETAQGFPMFLETKRISPGDMNTWYLRVTGTKSSAEFTTKEPKTLRTMPFEPGKPQSWHMEDIGYDTEYKSITGGIFEFGFSDSILQMWAAFLDELAHGPDMIGKFRCATPDEALVSHRLFTAALESQKTATTVSISRERRG